MTDHDDIEPAHATSPTEHVLSELQLFGYRPFDDQPDPRPLPEGKMITGAVADIFDALVATLSDTRLEPDLENLLWSTVNVFHRAVDRVFQPPIEIVVIAHVLVGCRHGDACDDRAERAGGDGGRLGRGENRLGVRVADGRGGGIDAHRGRARGLATGGRAARGATGARFAAGTVAGYEFVPTDDTTDIEWTQGAGVGAYITYA